MSENKARINAFFIYGFLNSEMTNTTATSFSRFPLQRTIGVRNTRAKIIRKIHSTKFLLKKCKKSAFFCIDKAKGCGLHAFFIQ